MVESVWHRFLFIIIKNPLLLPEIAFSFSFSYKFNKISTGNANSDSVGSLLAETAWLEQSFVNAQLLFFKSESHNQTILNSTMDCSCITINALRLSAGPSLHAAAAALFLFFPSLPLRQSESANVDSYEGKTTFHP